MANFKLSLSYLSLEHGCRAVNSILSASNHYYLGIFGTITGNQGSFLIKPFLFHMFRTNVVKLPQ